MSRITSTSNTFKKLGITGIATDRVAYKLTLLHQLEPKIVHHQSDVPIYYSGKYFVEGDVTEFLSGYSKFWVTSRECKEENEFEIDSSSYDSENLWTEITVTKSASYKTDKMDEGFNICGVYNVTDMVREFGDFSHQLFEEGSIGNSVASEFNVTLNDEDLIFYDRKNRNGLFYPKDVITEVKSVQAISDFSYKSGIHSTYVKVKNLTKNYTGSDFINGKVEFMSGNAAGNSAVVTEANGYNLRTLGYYSINYKDTQNYHFGVKSGDQVRVFKSDTFWYRLDTWLRDELDEKFSAICGKLFFDSIKINDIEKTVNISGYSTVVDLFNKSLSHTNFDNGLNCNRLSEIKTILDDKPVDRILKSIVRSAVQENPLSSVEVKQVGFDVSEGWHILDYHPYGNLFRFDLGDFFEVVDEGSFEKSTDQIFLASEDNWKMFNNIAKSPVSASHLLGDVESVTATPPVSPVTGKFYAIVTSATGVWAGHDGELAYYTGSTYVFYKSKFSWRVHDKTSGNIYVFDGQGWTTNTDLVDNIKLERTWHGKWCSISIAVEDSFHMASKNGMDTGNVNAHWRKLSGLPKFPFRILFYVDDDHKISFQNNFVYSFNNGGSTIPNLLFDYIESYDKLSGEHFRDLTYALGFGVKKDLIKYDESGFYESEARVPMENEDNTKYLNLRCYSFNKFNGIMVYFKNEGNRSDGSPKATVPPVSYSNFYAALYQQLRLKFTTGNNFSSDINLIYTGGNVSAVVSNSEFTLNIQSFHDDATTENYTNMVGMHILCVSGSNFLEYRKIQSISGTITSVTFVTETVFDNSVSTNDKFVVINKNINFKLYDKGNGFKDGIITDVLAIERNQTGNILDLIYNKWNDEDRLDLVVKPNDSLYIGSRSQFDNFYLSFDAAVNKGNSDDYADISWFLRKAKFVVEYYDGVEWKTAADVSVVPTTILAKSDDNSALQDEGNNVKLKFSFKANDWFTGGYSPGSWVASGTNNVAISPNNDNKVFVIKITMISEISILLSSMGIASSDETVLAITWDNIENWYTNLVQMKNKKVIVDTLNIKSVSLPMFGIELYSHLNQEFRQIRQIRPITKFEGSIGDNLYALIDYNNIDVNIDQDVLISNPDSDNGISHLPKNISFQHLINQIISTTSSKQTSKNLLFPDNYNQIDRKFTSIIGTGYDGCYPVEVGWDAALTDERLTEYFQGQEASTYIDICVIRDNGIYRLYAVKDNQTEIHLYESNDMKTWSYKSNIVSNLSTNKILSIEIVKNRNDYEYAYYVTYQPSGGNFKLAVYTSSDPDNLDMALISDIVTDASNYIGKCSVVHMNGLVSDSSPSNRLLWVTVHSGTTVDANNIPTGSPTLKLYYQNNQNVIGTWTNVATNDKSGYEDPCFVKCNYCINNGSAVNNTELINMMVICKKNSDGKLYRMNISLGKYYYQSTSWDDPVAVNINAPAINVSKFSCINDGIIYNLITSGTDSAYTMSPSTKEVNICLGIDSNGDFKGFVINNEYNDWNEDLWWVNNLIAFNDLDWVKSNKVNVILDDNNQSNQKKIYLGFRKPFNKIDIFTNTNDETKFLHIKYWNGIDMSDFDTIYQNGRKRIDSKFHLTSGIYFEDNPDWVSDKFENVISDSSVLNQRFQSLYWIEIYLDSDTVGDTADIKRIQNCYTSLFLTKNRELYLMENWTYIKSIYSYPFEMDKKILIDSIAFDREDKVAVVNYVEDNNYDYKWLESMAFDFFGKQKTSYPLWNSENNEGVNQHIVLKDKPDSIYRKGIDKSIVEQGSAVTLYMAIIGCWSEAFINDRYNGASSGDYWNHGYNIPIPHLQKVRKYVIRGNNWSLNGSYWEDDHLNNILLAKRQEEVWIPTNLISTEESYQQLLFSLTNTGLVYEELINGPFTKLTPGFYSALESSFLSKLMYAHRQVIDDETQANIEAVVSPSTNDSYLVTDAYFKNYIAIYDGVEWNYNAPFFGELIYNQTDGNYFIWDGYTWVIISADNLWPGRNSTLSNDRYGIGLEFSLGQEGIKIPYFRPYNNFDDKWYNNNVSEDFDYKITRMYRHLAVDLSAKEVIGHDQLDNGSPNYYFSRNLKPTCAVLMPDLTAAKDYDGPTDDQKMLEVNSPGMAVGLYEFYDTNFNDASMPTRQDANQVRPLANSGIGLFKPYGKIKNFLKAYSYNLVTYTDITDKLNYKDDTNVGTISINATPYFIYLCSDTKFFSLAISYREGSSNAVDISYNNNSGFQSVGQYQEGSPIVNSSYGSYNTEDKYSRKTKAVTVAWNPFIKNWVKTTINGVEGYWVRLSSGSVNNINWITLSGALILDNHRWWSDYDIESDVLPAVPSADADYRTMDTYVPICLEYDPDNKSIIGCFWDYASGVNKYYPFIINFDKKKISDDYYWLWEVSSIKFIDNSKYDFSKKIQSISRVSPIESKCLLVDPANPNNSVKIGAIKNVLNGNILFDTNVS